MGRVPLTLINKLSFGYPRDNIHEKGQLGRKIEEGVEIQGKTWRDVKAIAGLKVL